MIKLNTTCNKEVLVKQDKKFIIIELSCKCESGLKFNFDSRTSREFIEHIEWLAYNIWQGFQPKEATNMSSDYCEYYDRKLDNNGYFDIDGRGITIERPSLESGKLYQLNKRKTEALIWDVKNKDSLKRGE